MLGYWQGAEEEIQRWEDAGRHIPTQDQIDMASDLVGSHKGDASSSEAVKEFLRPLGIGVWKISEMIIVGWAGDPRAKKILGATLKELPEFLSSEDSEIRKLAQWRLGALT